MADPNIQKIPLEKLLLDLNNPRYDPRSSQREALATIAHQQNDKLVSLAKDIAENGLNPSDLPIVTKLEDADLYVVLEGNRRLAALKLLTNPNLLTSIELPKKLEKRFNALYEAHKNDLPLEPTCSIMGFEEARRWIQLKHTGENDGIGVVTWNAIMVGRFRGGSPALQATSIVSNNNYVSDEVKEKIKLQQYSSTNITRLLATPEVRDLIGIKVEDGVLSFLPTRDHDEVLGRLSMLVSEVVLKQIDVTDIEKKDDRIRVAKRIAAQPLPQPVVISAGTPSSGSPTSGTSAPPKKKSPRVIKPGRKTLIPKECKIAIPLNRINLIYHELLTLNVYDFPNSCGVMLRVFIELSLDHYAAQNGIDFLRYGKPSGGAKANPPGPISPKQVNLHEKVQRVVDYLQTNNICPPAYWAGIIALKQSTGHILSLDSLHAYVHNMSYTPSAEDLKAKWDTIQQFMEILWA